MLRNLTFQLFCVTVVDIRKVESLLVSHFVDFYRVHFWLIESTFLSLDHAALGHSSDLSLQEIRHWRKQLLNLDRIGSKIAVYLLMSDSNDIARLQKLLIIALFVTLIRQEKLSFDRCRHLTCINAKWVLIAVFITWLIEHMQEEGCGRLDWTNIEEIIIVDDLSVSNWGNNGFESEPGLLWDVS